MIMIMNGKRERLVLAVTFTRARKKQIRRYLAMQDDNFFPFFPLSFSFHSIPFQSGYADAMDSYTEIENKEGYA